MSCTKQIYYPVVRIYSGTPFPCFVMVYLACGTILEYISEPFQCIVSKRWKSWGMGAKALNTVVPQFFIRKHGKSIL